MKIKKIKMKKLFSFLFGCLILILVIIRIASWSKIRGAAEVHFGLGPPEAGWFQVEGGDVYGGGNISSAVPAGKKFLEDPQAVVSYTGSTDFGKGTAPNWQVKDSSISLSSFNYTYFASNIATSNLPCNPAEASCWANLASGSYRYSGNINMPGSTINFNNQKIIVLVGGNLNINEKIRVSSDSFLAFIVSGSININGNVTETGINPALEGIYFAQGTIATGKSNKTFIAKGIFVAQGGFTFGRDLGEENKTTPAEKFIFDPGLLVKMPKALKKSAMSWQEVAP